MDWNDVKHVLEKQAAEAQQKEVERQQAENDRKIADQLREQTFQKLTELAHFYNAEAKANRLPKQFNINEKYLTIGMSSGDKSFMLTDAHALLFCHGRPGGVFKFKTQLKNGELILIIEKDRFISGSSGRYREGEWGPTRLTQELFNELINSIVYSENYEKQESNVEAVLSATASG